MTKPHPFVAEIGGPGVSRPSLILTDTMLQRGCAALYGIAGDLVDGCGCEDRTLVAVIVAAALGFERWQIETEKPSTALANPAGFYGVSRDPGEGAL